MGPRLKNPMSKGRPARMFEGFVMTLRKVKSVLELIGTRRSSASIA